jgi:hypothetical protein
MSIRIMRAGIARNDLSDANGWCLHIELLGLVLNITIAR